MSTSSSLPSKHIVDEQFVNMNGDETSNYTHLLSLSATQLDNEKFTYKKI